MREKPVPVRVGKGLQSETSMETVKEEANNFEKETRKNTDEDIVSKELPSMVSVVPMDSPNESLSKYDTRLYQTAMECRPSLDIPGEFEFLNCSSVSESQKQAVKFGVRVFRDWLYKQGVQFQSLEDMSRTEIASALEQFYRTARRPNGTQYKKNTLKSIKHSLDHYLRSSPFKKDFSISTDYDFRQVNRTLDSLPEDADQNRFPQFTKETILKLYKGGQLGLTTTNNPSVIIQTVWFYIVAYFFTSIDKRMLRELKESNLVFAKDEEEREYYWLDYKPPERIRGVVHKSRIYARPGSLCCPITIIKKYMEHRNPRNDVLFQHPKKINHHVWYSPLPLGKNKHTDLMKSMCLNAGVDPPLTGRCIRRYVQELLQDCDEAVNEMFQPEGSSPTGVAMPGTLLPKLSPMGGDTSMVPPFVLSVTRLPSHTSSTTVQGSHVNIQPHTTISMSSSYITNHVATMVANQRVGNTSNRSATRDTHVTTTPQHGEHLAIQGNHITTNPSNISSISTLATFPNGFLLPYPTAFPNLNDFAKPRRSFEDNETSASVCSKKETTSEISCNRNGSQASITAHRGTSPSSNESNHHQDNGSSIFNSNGTCSSPVTAEEATIPETVSEDQSTTVEISTQTDPGNRQWLESTYHKADLKTRNRMRLQARKSLLCFLEELNEISDGHGTELFYEIVQEDTDMWRSITKPTYSAKKFM